MSISHEALALIALRFDAVPNGCPFHFFGDARRQLVIKFKRFWKRMREKAVTPDVRIHDRRYTSVSLV